MIPIRDAVGLAIRCPDCGGKLMSAYAMRLQCWHLECADCDWMANVRDRDLPISRPDELFRPLDIGHFREGWQDAPLVKPSELVHS